MTSSQLVVNYLTQLHITVARLLLVKTYNIARQNKDNGYHNAHKRRQSQTKRALLL